MLTFVQFIVEEPETSTKGWMSPTGKAHYVPSDDEHGYNLPSELSKKVKSQRYDDRVKEAQLHGYARFGYHPNYGHYIHYDHSNPKGRRAAAHALNHLKPSYNSNITICKSPGFAEPQDEHTVKSPSEAHKMVSH
jgi:hypothetical protein